MRRIIPELHLNDPFHTFKTLEILTTKFSVVSIHCVNNWIASLCFLCVNHCF